MSVIKWETLKAKALCAFNEKMSRAEMFPEDSPLFLALYAAVISDPPMNPRVLVEDWRTKGEKIIRAWDIRCAMKLVAAFPSILSKRHKGMPVAEYNDKAEWVLVFNSRD